MKRAILKKLGLLYLPVQQNDEASDHLRRMQARTLVYKLMVASPVLFFGTIAGEARFSADPYEFDSATRLQHAEISAYIEPYKQAKALLESDSGHSPDKVRKIARIWIDGYNSGQLKPLTPAYHGDSIREGVKGQIKDVNDELVSLLIGSFRTSLDAGHTKVALQDGLLAIGLSEVLKYSDSYSVSSSGIHQRNIVSTLKSNIDKFSSEEKKQLLSGLTKVKAAQHPIHEIVRHAQWLYVLDCQKKGEQPLEIEDPSTKGNVRSASLTGFTSVSAKALGERIKNAEDLTGMPTLYSELRMAYSSQDHVIRALNDVTARLELSLR